MIGEIEAAFSRHQRGHIATAPALVAIGNRRRAADHQHGSGFLVIGVHGHFGGSHVHGRIDERGFHQGGRWSQSALSLPVPLHEHGAGTAHVRAGLRSAALEQVVLVDAQPGVGVAGHLTFQRGDPGAGSSDVGFDAAVLRGAAAGEIRHGLGSFSVEGQVEPVVLAGRRRDDVFGDGWGTDGLLARTRIAGAEFEDVRLFSRGPGIGVPHQGVKFCGAQVVASLSVVTPGVGSDVGATAHRVPCQRLVTGWSEVVAGSIEQALGHQMSPGGHTQSPEVTVVVLGSDGPAAGHDARAVGSVTVLVGGVFKAAVGKEGVDPALQVAVHRLGLARVQAGIGDGHCDPAPIETEALDFGLLSRSPVVAHQDFRGDLIDQFHATGRFHPQHGLRSGQFQDAARGGLAPEENAEGCLGPVHRSAELT